MHSVEGFRNFQVELTQLVSKYLHDKKENMNSVIRDPIYLKLDMNAVKSEFSMVQWMTWLMNKVFDLTQEERKEKTEKRITNTKVIDIALEVGFDTLPYFSSVFKKYTGVSPAEFRKKE